MSVKSVKAFYARLAVDEAFQTKLENTASKDDYRKIMQNAGYAFTQEEF